MLQKDELALIKSDDDPGRRESRLRRLDALVTEYLVEAFATTKEAKVPSKLQKGGDLGVNAIIERLADLDKKHGVTLRLTQDACQSFRARRQALAVGAASTDGSAGTGTKRLRRDGPTAAAMQPEPEVVVAGLSRDGADATV